VNPIDNDRPWIGFVRQNQNPTEITGNKPNNHEVFARKSSETQLAGLLLLIKDAPEISFYNERINQLKAEIRSNTYDLDLDNLVENILASDYEL
jgi:anti-sigma28 factor (negative regulator of flagellin synthesis)